MRRLLLAVLVMVVPALFMATPAGAEPRVALVIGNSKYQGDLPKLPNPANDAALMSATLKKLGFTVIETHDADLTQMNKSIRDFSDKLSAAGGQAVGLFFYAGHGLQIDGENWLIPVNAKIDEAKDAEFEAINASKILGQMEFAQNSLNIVILDACRNNPLSRGMRSGGTGLAKMDAPLGSFIAYSTAPGMTAADGKGKNSPYTAALAKAIQRPGIAIEEAFRDARVEVLASTDKQQIPWESSSLTGAFQFNPGPKVAEPQVAAAAPAPAPAPAPAAAPTAKTPDAPGGKVAMCKDCPEMVAIPAGEFMMGSPDDEDDRNEREGPQTKMTIRAFSMGKYPVTRGQFAEFIQATGYKPARRCFAEVSHDKWETTSKANWENPGFKQTDRDPVICISWDDMQAYIEWLSQATGKAYRLPSEAEWEYAARAGTTTSRYWGDDADEACAYANASDATVKKEYGWKGVVDCDDGYLYTSPVGKFKPNKFGLYDMMGNARQLTAGCLTDSIADLPKDGSPNEECDENHPMRGSSWESYPTVVMRIACREAANSTEAAIRFGFRLALSQ
ncbi:SUMF1/EgtB/PvdO family nonheme iron enzyme [Dongia sp.]|uniref:SUMF1/EgtB/PvdO family nonheme iron enzyme n=1 Tax=Dongia sp. TaxID=1977262 RepID=UPI003751941F